MVTSAFTYDTGKKRATPGTLITLEMIDGEVSTWDGLFCNNCHPKDSLRKVNGAHANGWKEHKATPCVSCHILVPHGGSVSRLIADRGTGDSGGGTPARLAYRGDKNYILVESFTKRAGPDYSKSDCTVTSDSGCNAHDVGRRTGPNDGGTWENW